MSTIQNPSLPKITISWDAASQQPILEFDTEEFRTWEMVLMVLEGGRLKAEDSRRLSILNGIQQQAIAQQQAEARAQREAATMRRAINGINGAG